MISSDKLNQGINDLRQQGFDLFATLAVNKLPEKIKKQLLEADIGSHENSHLVLIGNAGRRLWDCISPLVADQSNPIDSYSIQAAEAFTKKYLNHCEFKTLYPGPTLIPLQQLGGLAGWHHNSPFGVGVNNRWGPWFAYRALLIVNAALPEVTSNYGSPCPTCTEKICTKHCPAQAISSDKQIDLDCCARFRLEKHSPCADRCLARMSCPVATNEEYSTKQIQYHYRLSLETLRHYYN